MEIEKYLIPDSLPIADAIRRLDEGKHKIVFCTHNGCLSGSFTDGDMRRFVLRDSNLNTPVSFAMNRNPISLPSEKKAEAESLFLKSNLNAIPIVDSVGKVIDICFRDDEDLKNRLLPTDMPLVIMAGGKGTRLYPYTQILPKALIPIGDVPITDRIIKHFQDYGIEKVFMVVNHKKNMIKAYYNEERADLNVRFVEESVFMGTGGGIKLLKGLIDTTFFLSNCDCLIESDYKCMLDFHKSNNNAATMIVSNKFFQIPYGVVDIEKNGAISNMREKPEFSFLVNTGIYILEPVVFDFIGENEEIGMPSLIQRLKDNGFNIGAYPITEKSWLDMGQLAEMNNMIKELGLENRYN